MRRSGWLDGHDENMRLKTKRDAPVIATAITRFIGHPIAIGSVGGAEEASLATAIDRRVTEEGEVSAFFVLDKLEQSMTHPERR